MCGKYEVESIIDKFYEIISGKTGEAREWDMFRALFFTNAVLTPMKYADGECITKVCSLESYIEGLSKFLDKNDFYEYGLNYRIEIYGNIAQVYSEYEAKRTKEDVNIIKSGVNLIQLLNDGKVWKISSMLWQDNN
ncbi:MAG: hypothetical protein ACOZCL_04300 [Bacillota bacterium]